MDGQHDPVPEVVDERAAGGAAGQPGRLDVVIGVPEAAQVPGEHTPSGGGVSDLPSGDRRLADAAAPGLPALPWINYVRVPAALSGLLLLVWFPLILRLTASYHASTTLSPEPYLWHWLAVTGVLFLLSAVAFAARLRGTSQRTPPPDAGRQAWAAHRADPVPPADGAGQARSATIRAQAWPAAEEIRADPAPGEEPEHPVTGAGLARPAGGESQARPAHEATGTHPAEEQGEATRGAVAEDGDGDG